MAIKNSNGLLVQFAVNKLGVPYIMGTNGKVFTNVQLRSFSLVIQVP